MRDPDAGAEEESSVGIARTKEINDIGRDDVGAASCIVA